MPQLTCKTCSEVVIVLSGSFIVLFRISVVLIGREKEETKTMRDQKRKNGPLFWMVDLKLLLGYRSFETWKKIHLHISKTICNKINVEGSWIVRNSSMCYPEFCGHSDRNLFSKVCLQVG